MIFSKAKWNDAEEIKRYEGVSASCSFETFSSALGNAYNKYIVPLLGGDMVARLEEIYTDTVPSLDREATLPARLLFHAQYANLYLALSDSYNALSVIVDDNGVSRPVAENSATPYKYQENALKYYYRNTGLDALDRVIDFLCLHISDFPEFLTSPTYSARRGNIVNSPLEVDRYYPIGGSSLVFLRLRPEMQKVEDLIVAPRLGNVYTNMKSALQEAEVDARYEHLRTILVPCVALYAVSRALLNTASLTDKGLYFTATESEDEFKPSSPAPDGHLSQQSRKASEDADNYWANVLAYVKAIFGEGSCASSRLPQRDNDHKKTFWV